MCKIIGLYQPKLNQIGQQYQAAWVCYKQSRIKGARQLTAARSHMANHIKKVRKKVLKKSQAEGFQLGLQEAQEFCAELEKSKLQHIKALELECFNLMLCITKKIIHSELIHNQAALKKLLELTLTNYAAESIVKIEVAHGQEVIFKELPFNIVSNKELTAGNFKIHLSSGALQIDWQKNYAEIENSLKLKLQENGYAI